VKRVGYSNTKGRLLGTFVEPKWRHSTAKGRCEAGETAAKILKCVTKFTSDVSLLHHSLTSRGHTTCLERGLYPSNRGACTLKNISAKRSHGGQQLSYFLSFFGAHSFGHSIFFFSFNLLSLLSRTATKKLVAGRDLSLLDRWKEMR
jgi:hypothetical protein